MFSISKRPTINEIHTLYKEEKATPSQIVSFFLYRITEIDKKINSFYSVLQERAEARAIFLEDLIKEAKKLEGDNWFEKLLEKYPLFGIPYGLKSIVMAMGEEFHASSNILRGFKAPYSSTVFEKIDQSGGILMGININDQFAVGASGETSDFGVTKNPFDETRVCGGSSCGSAGAVSAGLVVFSIGSDTGGSIRQPGAFTDTVGLKPTYGLVSRYGVMAMASSLDQPAPLTNTVEDCLAVISVMAGQDKNDQTSIDSVELIQKLQEIQKTKKIYKNLKIGIPKEFYVKGTHPKITQKLESLQKALEQKGHTIIDISIPLVKYAVSVYYMIMPVEFASNMERIDGIRYAVQESDYPDRYFTHRTYFGDEPKRRIMLGTYISSAGYYDAYYNKAQKVRELARQSFVKALDEVDVLLTPTTPEFPFKIGEKTSDPLQMYLSDVFTCGINPVRIPSLNLPLGMFEVETDNGKTLLPSGCQIMSKELSEDLIFGLGLEIQELSIKNKF
jgi:aspartyl-tRNA(Asn)/glutamyl-tRNA(Gln) amidotransferase subunit A